NLTMAAVWFALTFAAAPAIAHFFGSPAGIPVLQALAWTFPLKALGNTHDALLQRELRFRARALPEVLLLVAKAAVAIPLALRGFGVWSLVWGQLAGQALWTCLLWFLVPWRPARRFPPVGVVRQVFTYGRGVVAVNVLAAVVHHIDLVVIGRSFGTAVLAFYQMADKLPDMAVTLVSRATSKVLFPLFARLHSGNDALRDMYVASLRNLSLLTTPASIALVMLAEPIVLTVFGPQWLPSVPILRALGAYAGIRALSASAGDVLKAIGRPGTLAAFGVVRAVVLIPALLLASAKGPVAVAATLTGVTTISTIATIFFICRLRTIPIRAVTEALRPSFAAGSVLAISLVIVLQTTARLAPSLQLIIASVVGLTTYGVALSVLSPDIWRDVLRTAAVRRNAPTRATVLAEADA
ncbi:MAG TPA: oligosaccharide flippase family protein, partial [Gemmatimonadaceae bacterium]|nr:oligosaccharide flippase family protein [Gemmatimonadaceae bacterium]